MEHVCIEFDECKPHWAKKARYPELATACGMTNLTLSGDFDLKITRIYGVVDSFEAFSASIAETNLKHGSLYRVAPAVPGPRRPPHSSTMIHGVEVIPLGGDFYEDMGGHVIHESNLPGIRTGTKGAHMKRKYYLEIDASDFEGPCDEGRFLGYGLITAEGNSLAECQENAQVDLIDQDGGEYDIRPADSEAFQDLIEKTFMEQYPPPGRAPMSSAKADREYLEAEQQGRDSAEANALNRENGRG